jgi:Protein of unknown function (DUF2442)
MGDMTQARFAAASARGEARLQGPRAKSAHYDSERNRVVICLNTGVEIGFAPQDAQGLEHASAADLKEIEITPAGLGVHFPRLDADLYVPALLEGLLGSAAWMAKQMGKAGGKSRSPGKAAAARENGKRGGRPRKNSAA